MPPPSKLPLLNHSQSAIRGLVGTAEALSLSQRMVAVTYHVLTLHFSPAQVSQQRPTEAELDAITLAGGGSLPWEERPSGYDDIVYEGEPPRDSMEGSRNSHDTDRRSEVFRRSEDRRRSREQDRRRSKEHGSRSPGDRKGSVGSNLLSVRALKTPLPPLRKGPSPAVRTQAEQTASLQVANRTIRVWHGARQRTALERGTPFKRSRRTYRQRDWAGVANETAACAHLPPDSLTVRFATFRLTVAAPPPFPVTDSRLVVVVGAGGVGGRPGRAELRLALLRRARLAQRQPGGARAICKYFNLLCACGKPC